MLRAHAPSSNRPLTRPLIRRLDRTVDEAVDNTVDILVVWVAIPGPLNEKIDAIYQVILYAPRSDCCSKTPPPPCSLHLASTVGSDGSVRHGLNLFCRF